jgi:CelD/BcsL family acetyltransferase involved in cellulose biosynthesis
MPQLVVEELNEWTDFINLQEPWNKLLKRSHDPKIFFCWEWYYSWLQHFNRNKDFHLILVRDNRKELVGIAPLVIKHQENNTIIEFIGDSNTWDYRDLIIDQSMIEPVLMVLIKFLEDKIRRKKVLELSGLAEDSLIRKSIIKLADVLGLSIQLQPEDTCPILFLPATWEEYRSLLKKKDRHELERKTRKIYREGKVTLSQVTDPWVIKDRMEEFFALHRASRPEKADFMNNDMKSYFFSLAQLFRQRGWLKLSFLSMNDKNIAAVMGFEYLNTLYIYNSGYDPFYSYLSPGIVLLGQLIREAIDKSLSKVDFLRGDESYKYNFGAVDNLVYKVILQF